jgi:hypothetical protein
LVRGRIVAAKDPAVDRRKLAPILGLLIAFLATLLIGPSASAAPPPAPTLLAPSNGASVTVPFTISWSQVLDPLAVNGGYNWEVSSSSTFSTLVARDSTSPGVTQATISGLANGTYFWRVDAVNGTVETGAWSATRSFTVTGAGAGQLAAPTLNPPHGGTTQFHPYEAIRFSWSAVPGAATYKTEFSTDPSFPVTSANYYSVGNIPGTSDGTLHDDSMPMGTWFVRVRAVDANQVAGAASNVISFSVLYGNPVGPAPALVSPVGNPTLTLPITISWGDSYNPQSSGYELQVSQSSSFSTLFDPVPGLTQTSILYPDMPSGTWFWRVRSHQGMASPTTTATTAWSATGSFTISSAPAVLASIGFTREPLIYSGAEYATLLQLTARAPAGGAVVNLTSSNLSALPVPPTATIEANRAQGGPATTQFAGQVTTPTPVSVTATYNGSSVSRTVTVMPPTLKQDTLQSVVKATGGATMLGRVELAGGGFAGPGGVLVNLSSSSPAATVPATVTIPAGAISSGFIIPTSEVASTTIVTISASHGGTTVQWDITLAPMPPPATLTLMPISTTNGSQGTVTIPASANAGFDQLVRVTSSNPTVASVPQFATVSAGSGIGRFDIATGSVSAPTVVTISVSGGGVTRSASLTVSPSLPALTSLTVSPTSVVGGNSASGSVTLAGPAPTGGVVVGLGSNLPGSASVPASVTVPAGATSASFAVTTFPVDTTTVQLSASLDNVFQFAALTVTRAPTSPTLSSLSVSPSSVVGGSSSTGTVTLSSAAPSGGTTVTLSDNSTAATVPASVSVNAGLTSRTFTITTGSVTGSTPVTISGSAGGATRTATLTVNPAAPAAPSLLSPAGGATVALPATFDWSDVSGATSYRIQIDDSSNFSAPRVVDQTLTVSQFTTGSLPIRQHWWRVRGINSSGTAGPWSSVRTFTPQSTPVAPSLSAISLNPASVLGGSSSSGTATLTSAAPTGGAIVTLTSSDTTTATVPASVTVPAGSTSATFAVTTSPVLATSTATITGAYGGTTRTASLSVTPPGAPAALSGVSVNPAILTGGTASQGTITLTAPAGAGGFAVSLSSDNTAATVPGSVTVAQGSTSATFAIGTSSVATSTPVTITATTAGVTRTATLTLTPPAQGVTLTVTASGRSGERITSSPAGINVSVGASGSAQFAAGTSITLSVTNGRDAIWSGACSSGGGKARNCTFTINANASVSANVQ